MFTQLESFELPRVPAIDYEITNPILECVKYMIEVLKLHKASESEVRLLRRDVLKMIGQKEFDEICIHYHF